MKGALVHDELRRLAARLLQIPPSEIEPGELTSERSKDWGAMLQLARESRRLAIRLEPPGDAPALARGKHLNVSYNGAASREDIRWLEAQAPRLSSEEARCVAEWLKARVPAPPPANWREVEGLALSGQDLVLLPLLHGFEAHFGSSVRIRRHVELPDAATITYPKVDTPNEFFPDLGPATRSNGPIRSYLAELGYTADDDGVIRTVPTPASFLACTARLELTPAFAPRQVRLNQIRFRRLHWLRLLVTNRVPVNYADQGLYRRLAVARRLRLNRSRLIEDVLASHLCALGHDMSTHVLALHRIPGTRARELCDAAARAIPARGARVRFAAGPLADFFEEDLTLLCSEIWRAIGSPEEFEPAFEERWDEVQERFQSRVAAAKRGLGWRNWHA